MVTRASEPLTIDRYEVLRQLGSGAMGAVYEGRHRITGRQVAIKVLHRDLVTNRDIVERFLNEARAAATLGHPNIVGCLDAGVASSGQAYLVLEYLEGQSLATEIEEQGVIPPVRAVRIALQVASALSAAHARGVVHRDLKPDNIFLSLRDGRADHVTVLDFGISRFHAANTKLRTQAGAVLGTPAYMAPEQLADSSTVEGTADIYALGATLYQALTGSVPFSASSLIALAAKIATEPPRPLEAVRPGLSPSLGRVVLRAMAKAPRDRYATMEAFGAALASAAGIDPEESTARGNPDLGQPRTEEVEVPEEAPEVSAGRSRPGVYRGAAEPMSTSQAWVGTKPRRGRLALGAALGGLLALAAVVVHHSETPIAEPVQIIAGAPLTPRVAAPVAAPDVPPVVLAERTLTVPSARPGIISPLALGIAKVTLPSPKPRDAQLLAQVTSEANKPTPSIKELEKLRKPFDELAEHYPSIPIMQIARASLALTLAEAQRPPNSSDFTGRGCSEPLLAEAHEIGERVRKMIDQSIVGLEVLQATNRGYLHFFAGVADECAGNLLPAADEYRGALKIEMTEVTIHRSVGLHLARLLLALHDAHGAQEMLDQLYEAHPSHERQLLELWTGALTGNCDEVLPVARDLRQTAIDAQSPPPAGLDGLEAACIVDPTGDRAKSDPSSIDVFFGGPGGQAKLAEARRLFADDSTPAAALESALRLCYFRDRLASPGDPATVSIAGRLEQPAFSGEPADRVHLLQGCVTTQLAASHQRGPITPTTVTLRVGGPL